ncbi:hypothetical protein H112_05433, partial [Trichophyton rubrum D6]
MRETEEGKVKQKSTSGRSLFLTSRRVTLASFLTFLTFLSFLTFSDFARAPSKAHPTWEQPAAVSSLSSYPLRSFPFCLFALSSFCLIDHRAPRLFPSWRALARPSPAMGCRANHSAACNRVLVLPPLIDAPRPSPGTGN